MNKRIRELMIEAGFAAPELAGRANKLVELLIQECANFIDKNNIIDRYGEVETLASGDELVATFSAPDHQTMKPCPFCGHAVDLEDGDTLYPNGTGWQVRDNGMTSYHSFREVPKEHWCWSMHCPTTAGGCGVEISANSREEAIQKWNQRS